MPFGIWGKPVGIPLAWPGAEGQRGATRWYLPLRALLEQRQGYAGGYE